MKSRLLAAALALAAALIVAAPALSARGFTLDDGWISQVVARNLATTGVWGFETGKLTSGATSILWTLLLALGSLLRLDPVWSTFFLNALLLAGITVLFEMLLRDDGVVSPAAGFLAVLPALLGNTAWLATTGLEPLLLAFLSLLAILLWRRRSPWAGVACGLAVLTRPEAVGLGLLLAALSVRRRDAGRRSEIAILLCPLAAACALTVGLSWITSRGFLPATLEGRRWLYGIEGIPPPRRLLGYGSAWLDQITRCAFGAPAVLTPLIVLPILIGIVGVARRLHGLAALLAWAALLNALYLAILPSLGHGGRYQPLNLLLAPLLAAIGLAPLLRASATWFGGRGRAEIVAALLVAAASLPSLWAWREVTRVGVKHLGEVHVGTAAWVRDSIPVGEAVAAFDIGALAYFGGHRVIDLGGLVERESLPYMRERRAAEYLGRRGARYVVLPMTTDESRSFRSIGSRLGLLDRPGVLLERLASFASERAEWEAGFRATGHAGPRLTVYRVELAPAP